MYLKIIMHPLYVHVHVHEQYIQCTILHVLYMYIVHVHVCTVLSIVIIHVHVVLYIYGTFSYDRHFPFHVNHIFVCTCRAGTTVAEQHSKLRQ